MRGVRANVTVWVPACGPGTSEMTAPFEMAIAAAGAVTDRSNVALKAGSSKPGNIRRPSVASSCVTAYFFPFAVLR